MTYLNNSRERQRMLKVQAQVDQSEQDLMLLLFTLGQTEDKLLDFINDPVNSQVKPEIKLEFLRLYRAIRKVRNRV